MKGQIKNQLNTYVKETFAKGHASKIDLIKKYKLMNKKEMFSKDSNDLKSLQMNPFLLDNSRDKIATNDGQSSNTG
jgi:hypothetical protein